MKIQWSALFTGLALTTLVGCGNEQFGAPAKSTNSSTDPLTQYSQYSCTSSTYIKPKVDILYVVDNSLSTFSIQDAAKTAIKKTAENVALKDYDYRIISLKLINPPTDNTPNNDYLVFTNSTDELPDVSRKVSSPSELINFSDDGRDMERGLTRTLSFIQETSSLQKPLFRKNANLIVVLVSNGHDDGVAGNGTFESVYNQYKALKEASYVPGKFRFLSVTAKATTCGKLATTTYDQMSSRMANLDGASSSDSFDICSSSGLGSIFENVNSTINSIIVPHRYRFWPMTFAKSSDPENAFGTIKVYKVSPNSEPVEMTSGWSRHTSSRGWENTRELPTVGEPVNGKYFIRFDDLVTYPDCIQIAATSRTEYFGYIVVPRKPVVSSIIVKINGLQLPSSAWTFTESYLTYPVNIKMPHPNAGDELPAVMKSGYMIKLNGSSNYYKSGDSVQVDYTPTPI